VNSDERMGLKEGAAEEDGKKHSIIGCCDMWIVFITLKL
jgi:hypothetical protein